MAANRRLRVTLLTALTAGGAGIPPGDRGEAGAFDVARTLIDLLGEQPAEDLSGQSLTPRLFTAR